MNVEHAITEIAELAGGLAHELRNPLSTMMINLKLLAEDLRDRTTSEEDVRRRALLKVDRLRREAERLQRLFDDFLRVVGPCRLDRKLVEINGLLAGLVEFFAPFGHGQGVELKIIARSEPLLCPVDEALLRQALLNLVLNAQQAMPTGGTITLSAKTENDEAVLEVADTGVGIAKTEHDRILRPFFSTKPGGTGLGLSITQRIVHEHGGKVDFTSEVGRGTTFRLRLPMHPPTH